MDYEQKYKEALERARKLHSEFRTIVGINIPEEIFPELKESEDEKIRKGLIEYLKADMEYMECNPSQNESFYKKSIAWLEKQGESKDKG